MSIPSAVGTPVTALFAEAEGDKSGTGRVSVLVTCWNQVNPDVFFSPLILYFWLIFNLQTAYMTETDRNRKE